MRTVVLGGGTVGTWIADLLCQNRHSVTVVDHDPQHTRRINDELDVRAITGSASQSSVMFQADVIGADLCLAVTGDDEVNIVGASMAKAMGARRSVARVYAPVFRDLSTFDYQRHFGIDRLLSLEHLSAMELARGIRSAGSVVLENFARGELEVQEVLIREKTAAVGVPLKELGLPKRVRVGSISRDDRMWIAGAMDTIEINDRITLIGRREDVDAVRETVQRQTGTKRGVVIAGGGETGYHLARTLEDERFAVLLMEENPDRCEFLANHLDHTTVVQADATRRTILEEERVGSADYFIACTGDDENNIMAGVEARDIGAKNIMAVVGRPDYAAIVGKLGITLAVSPRDTMARQVLSFLNTGAVISRTALPGGDIGVYEVEVLEGVPATEHVLANLELPEQCLIAAVMREDYVRVPTADERLHVGEIVLALIDDSVVEAALAQFNLNGAQSMNLPLVSKLLGVVAFLIGGTMIFSLPWAYPGLGYRANPGMAAESFEMRGFVALLASLSLCFLAGGALHWYGRQSEGQLFRKEAMAAVGLSWVLATVLGAFPFYLSGVYRDNGVPMSIVDCLFESQSGFSTTGATVISQLEDPQLVPHCILFWRSSTHFLGGLGIIVLFVVILGQGSAGKALMRAEMPGPTKEGSHTRMQHTAWLFAGIYCGLNASLALLLWCFPQITLFDALCHAFGTMATGGFSIYNKSVGYFDHAGIDSLIIVFMLLAGTNFTLIYFLIVRQPRKVVSDPEWRVYISLIFGVTLLVIVFGFFHKDFVSIGKAIRFGLFQVVSIITTTGYGTSDFDGWNSFGRGALFLLMFVGGCAGSTGGGMKVIRFILFAKILRLEIEQAYHPTVVRPLRLAGKPVPDQELRKGILVYFGLISAIFVLSWIFVVTTEPDRTWDRSGVEHKLIDSASGVAATLNNIGPGLGTVGASQNYGHFSWHSKLLFIWLMMIGRLEIFSILVLVIPSFWRTR